MSKMFRSTYLFLSYGHNKQNVNSIRQHSDNHLSNAADYEARYCSYPSLIKH
jgi:hypothetical protein